MFLAGSIFERFFFGKKAAAKARRAFIGRWKSAALNLAMPTTPATTNAKAKTGAKIKAGSATPVNAAERKFIAPGINDGEVMARLGPPDMKSGGGTRKTARWTYLPAPDDPGTVTTLTFESGRLVEVERKVVK